jgi:DNA invertase Pin-like site-specific DNA recombinase
VLDLQRDALIGGGVSSDHLYEDHASGKRDDRPGLDACLKSLRKGDALVAWKLDRINRDLRHLVNLVHDLAKRGVGLRVLAGEGTAIDTTTPNGRLMFGFFAALSEFDRELIVERTKAGLASARARGRNGGRPFKMTTAKLRLAQAAMSQLGTRIDELCIELGVSRQTLYRHMNPTGQLRPDGEKLLGQRRGAGSNGAERLIQKGDRVERSGRQDHIRPKAEVRRTAAGPKPEIRKRGQLNGGAVKPGNPRARLSTTHTESQSLRRPLWTSKVWRSDRLWLFRLSESC